MPQPYMQYSPTPTPRPGVYGPPQEEPPGFIERILMFLMRKDKDKKKKDAELDPYTIRPGVGEDITRVADNIENPNYMPTPTPGVPQRPYRY